jgi:hypothetical protein
MPSGGHYAHTATSGSVELSDFAPHSHYHSPRPGQDASEPGSSSASTVSVQARAVTQTAPPPPSGFLSHLWHSIMSRNPLLIRSSSALGTGSYGAVPVTARSSYSSSEDEAIDDDVVRIQSTHGVAEDHGHYANPRQRDRSYRRKRRSSSLTCDMLMGPDAKTTFGGTPPITERKAESSNASQRTQNGQSSDYEEEDPPDNSAYPEVRASVSPTDNTSLSINTPRMWILSLIFAIAGSATNLFFSLRYPSVAITPVIALVLVHPLGKSWDLLLKQKNDPESSFENGDPHLDGLYSSRPAMQRFRLWLAQGQWNEKEHACVYISSNVSFGFAFATDVIVEQHKFYEQEVPILYQLLLTISTQVLGYAFAGLTRRYLVRPAAMIWPGTLMSTAMFTTMHKHENKVANGWTISRYRFFIYVWAAAFAWYFLPGLLMPALSYFNVITWFAPKNVVIANLVCRRLPPLI